MLFYEGLEEECCFMWDWRRNVVGWEGIVVGWERECCGMGGGMLCLFLGFSIEEK